MNVVHRTVAGRSVLAIASVAFALSFGSAAAAGAGCSHDALSIDGTPLGVTICATKSDSKTLAIAETFTSKSLSLAHATTIDVLPGEESSRGIDDVPLAALGIAKTLHITMHYKAGAIALEHALLLPGAVPLK